MASDDRFRLYVRNVRNSLGKWTIRAALESMGCYNLVTIQTCRRRWSDSRSEGEHMSMFLSFGDEQSMNDGISCICANPHQEQLSSSGRPLEPSIALPPPARGRDVAPLPVPLAPSALPAPLPPPAPPTHGVTGATTKWAPPK
ncbi:unnamed protein product, partial [Effrenium voratum]